MNTTLESAALPGGGRLEIVQGDITLEPVDAIVNAANELLAHGGGLAAAIVRRGGAQIQAESSAWVRLHGPVTHAEPAWTGAGGLPARYVIHAVGPVWGSGDEEAKLTAAVTGALRLADELELASIAIPAISTGIFGFPKERAARVTLDAIHAYFRGRTDSGLKLVRLTLYDPPTLDAFRAAFKSTP